MEMTLVDVRHREMLERPLLGGKLTSAEALSNYVRVRWPSSTAKHVARTWDLTLDEAKGIVAARASRSTIDKAYERGGWPVALSVLGGVIGQGVAEFFQAEAERAKHEADERAKDAAALAAVERAAGAAVVRLVCPRSADDRPSVAGGSPLVRPGRSWSEAKALGSKHNLEGPQDVADHEVQRGRP